MAGNKKLVYCLSDGTTTAIHLNIDDLCERIKMEVDNMPDEDILANVFSISAKLMTEAEIDNLPEFDGF